MVHLGRDLANKTLEGRTWEQHVNRFLVPLDLTKSDSTGSVLSLFWSVLLLHAALGRCGLLDRLGSFDLGGHLGGLLGLGSSF